VTENPARQYEEAIHVIEHVAVSAPVQERNDVMDRTLRRFRVVLVTGLVMLSLTAFAGSASAASGPTPNGYVGACNMLNDATMATIPMVRNNPDRDIFAGNGNAGMWHALDVSGCS
jgi:hypothetical protein